MSGGIVVVPDTDDTDDPEDAIAEGDEEGTAAPGPGILNHIFGEWAG
jgi:hypothetical protein